MCFKVEGHAHISADRHVMEYLNQHFLDRFEWRAVTRLTNGQRCHRTTLRQISMYGVAQRTWCMNAKFREESKHFNKFPSLNDGPYVTLMVRIILNFKYPRLRDL